MCRSCSKGLTRREFVAGSSLALSLLPASMCRAAEAPRTADDAGRKRRKKAPAVLKAVFLYPLPEQCDQGKAEAGWQEHHWHPYPGNQFHHAEQQKKFTDKVLEMAKRIGMKIDIAAKPLTTDVEVDKYVAEIASSSPDAMLALLPFVGVGQEGPPDLAEH